MTKSPVIFPLRVVYLYKQIKRMITLNYALQYTFRHRLCPYEASGKFNYLRTHCAYLIFYAVTATILKNYRTDFHEIYRSDRTLSSLHINIFSNVDVTSGFRYR